MSYRIAISTSAVLIKLWTIYFLVKVPWIVIMIPTGSWVLICKALWTLLRGSFMHTFDPLYVPKWFTGCKPGNTQQDDSLLSLHEKWSGLGDSTELSRVGLSHLSAQLMRPWCWLNQSIPRITSIPLDFSITRSAGNSTLLKMILTREHPSWHLMSPPGFELIGVLLAVL
jgi:hypothetical protein